MASTSMTTPMPTTTTTAKSHHHHSAAAAAASSSHASLLRSISSCLDGVNDMLGDDELPASSTVMDTNNCNDNNANNNANNNNGLGNNNSNVRDYGGACVVVLRITHVEVLLAAWRGVLPDLTLR